MRRIKIWLLSVVIMSISISIQVWANVQLPVESFDIDNVHFVIGENIVTGEPILNPTMTVSWTDPDQWANDVNIHTPEYYELIVKNKTLGTSNTIKINDGTEAFTNKTLAIHNAINLKTGSFYELTIQPYHRHVVTNNGVQTYQLAPSAQEPEKAFAVTDLQVELISNEDSIQVVWDDLGVAEFEYRIVYAIGDFTSRTKQDLLDNAEGIITGITKFSDDVEAFYDPVEKRDKLSYTLNESIYPGQVYSIMVEPVAEYYEGETIIRNRNYPFIRSISTNVQLSLVEEGDYIRLQWEIPASFKVGQEQNEYALVEAVLMEYKEGRGRNLVIFDGDAAAVGYYRIQKPIWETAYELKLTYKAVDNTSKPDIEPISNRLSYVPSEFLIQPTKPYVPKVISQKIIDGLKETHTPAEIHQILIDDYLIPGYSYNGSVDDVIDKNVTFHIDKNNRSINYVWEAFKRMDVDVTSSTYGQRISDTNVYYDVWITDALGTLAYATPILDHVRYNSSTDSHVILDGENKIIGYKQQFNFYYDTKKKEVIEIVPNNIYYIKVQAKKVTAQGTLVSEPTISTIYYTYDGDAYEPPTIAKPPLEVKELETTEKEITLRWKESWYEVISPDAVGGDILVNWQHEMWVDAAGTIHNEAVDNAEYFPIYEGEAQIQRFKDYLATFPNPPTIVSRKVDLGRDNFGVSDVKYKFLKIMYQSVLDTIKERQTVDPSFSFKDYYTELIRKDKDGTGTLPWYNIVPYTDRDDSSFFAHKEEGLVENTSYLFILYPYRELFNGEVLYAHYPTPIVVSTAPEGIHVTPNPTVPSLYVTDHTDTTVTATWKYNTDFEYELMYARVEDIDEAKAIPIVLPENQLDPLYPRDGAYYNVVVKDLFPLTTYYFWVRAKKKDKSGASQWSNPANIQTKDAEVPPAPRGLGLAPKLRIEKYGYTQNVTEEHLIIEWIKNNGDIPTETASKVEKKYTYIVELADNPKFIDPEYVESAGGSDDQVPSDVEILEKTIVKFGALIPNRYYYVRVKSRLTIKGSEEGQLIKKESAHYSPTIKILTLSTGSEYDGYNDLALSVLPKENYELIYDEGAKILTYRFREGKKDSQGNADNHVEQRLISKLIQEQQQTYVIDLDGFKNKVIKKRQVILPYRIMEAFNTYHITLKVLADDMVLQLPVAGIMDAVTAQVQAYGTAPQVKIDIQTLAASQVKSDMRIKGLKTLATPKKVMVQIISDRKAEVLGYTNQPMTIGLKTTSRYALYNKETAVYIKNAQANWVKNKTCQYNQQSGRMVFDTWDIGSYGVYLVERSTAVTGSNQTPNHWSEKYRQAVYKQVGVKGIANYNPEKAVTGQALLQAVYGLVAKVDSIDLSNHLSNQQMTTLERSGLKQGVGQQDLKVSREAAISLFVRSYELLKGKALPLSTKVVQQIQINNQINARYKKAIGQAKGIGLIHDLETLRPKDTLTYGEFFTLWSKVMEE